MVVRTRERESLITRRRPSFIISLLLLCKPAIVSSVALTGFTGMVLAARDWPPLRDCLLCLSGLVLAASGSAIINCVLDARLDARMTRLEKRVRALDRVGKRAAVSIAAMFIVSAMAILFGWVNYTAGLLTLAASLSYAIFYTLILKRYSPYGAIPGGLPGALPALIGYAAIKPSLGIDAIILFAIMLLWQPPHFWSLALKYRDDYRAAGLPVLPVSKGERHTEKLALIFLIALIPASAAFTAFGYASIKFAVFSSILGAGFAATMWLFYRKRMFGAGFRSTIVYLVLLFSFIVSDVMK